MGDSQVNLNLQVNSRCQIRPHFVAIYIGCVTCYQNVPGSNTVWVAAASMWTYTSGA